MMSQFSHKPSQRKITILEALNEHPLLSRRQLELYLNCTERRAQKHLAELVHRGWVRHYNAKQPGLYTRSLFAITESGIEVLKQQGTDLSVCSSQRTARLALMMERVFKIRNLMLWLANAKLWNWRPSRWNCEVAVELAIREQTTTVPFHAAALFTRADKKWTWAVIEFDTRRASIESQRERWRALVIAQEDHTPRAIEFPVLIIVAADALRLQDYYTILHTTALTGQKPMPHAYLAVASDAIKLREDATAPIWYSTVSGRRTSLLFDASGNAIPLPSQTPWYTLPMSRQGTREPRIVEIKPLGKSELPVPGVLGLGSLALALEPIDKQLLDEVSRWTEII